MAQSSMRVTPAVAMRARDVSRPRAEHVEAAIRHAEAPPKPTPRQAKKRTRPARRS